MGAFSPSVLLDVTRAVGALGEQGLDVEETPVLSSPAQFAALRSGELDAALTSPDNVIAYRNVSDNPLGETLDVRIVSTIDRGLGLALYAAPGLGVADLRGAIVGVDVPTSGFALALYELTASLELDRSDYKLVTLGSTPRRLEALLAGDCAFTMLNAGNELRAEAAGCVRIASVAATIGPYLGTVLAVAGRSRLDQARRLSAALTQTAARITAGELTEQAISAATTRLTLAPDLAVRYVARLRDASEGLVANGVADHRSLAALVRLRSTHLPDGTDLAARALGPGSELLA